MSLMTNDTCGIEPDQASHDQTPASRQAWAITPEQPEGLQPVSPGQRPNGA
jgi:hypothetical protein